jgi:hypothetical protein
VCLGVHVLRKKKNGIPCRSNAEAEEACKRHERRSRIGLCFQKSLVLRVPLQQLDLTMGVACTSACALRNISCILIDFAILHMHDHVCCGMRMACKRPPIHAAGVNTCVCVSHRCMAYADVHMRKYHIRAFAEVKHA